MSLACKCFFNEPCRLILKIFILLMRWNYCREYLR